MLLAVDTLSGLAVLITALGVAVPSVIAAIRGVRVDRKMNALHVKADEVVTKVEEVRQTQVDRDAKFHEAMGNVAAVALASSASIRAVEVFITEYRKRNPEPHGPGAQA